jgi:hypothetical protein
LAVYHECKRNILWNVRVLRGIKRALKQNGVCGEEEEACPSLERHQKGFQSSSNRFPFLAWSCSDQSGSRRKQEQSHVALVVSNGPFFKIFPCKEIIKMKKICISGEVKDIINFLSFFLLHKLHKPFLPLLAPLLLTHSARELETHPSAHTYATSKTC